MKARSIFHFARDESGGTAVEFALVSIPLITLLFGIGAIAVMLYTNACLHWAVEHSARTASMNAGATQSQLSTEINGYLRSLGVPNATVTYSVAQGALPIAHITATISRTFIIPMVNPVQVNFSADTYAPQGVAP